MWASTKRRSRWQQGGQLGPCCACSTGLYPADQCLLPCRHESDTTDLYCIFDPDTAHRLAGWGRDWHETHRSGQADFKVGSLQCQRFSRKSPRLGGGGT